MLEYFVLFGLSLIIFFVINYLSRILDLLDKPSIRKAHKFNTPYTGGLAINILLLILFLTDIYNFDKYLKILIFSSSGIVIIGIVDDKYNLNVAIRLAATCFVTYFLVSNNFQILNFGNLFLFKSTLLGKYSIIITIICIIYLINSFNYLDGIDGVLGLTSLITLLSLNLIINDITGNFELLLNCLIVIIAVYLIFNFSNNKIFKIFLGNNGSYLLGYIIGSLGIYYCYILNILNPEIFIWLIALPVFEFLSTNFSRIVRGKNIFEPGKDHIQYIIDENYIRANLKLCLIHIIFIFIGVLLYNLQILKFSILIYILFFIIYFFLREKKIKSCCKE